MQQELANGLILRSLSEGYASDRERLPDFYAAINGEDDPPNVQEGLRIWTRDLMQSHPTVTPDDIFVVVDPARDNLIASATLLIPQTWRYAGVPFPVGRPELVGTHPDYRARGLVRALFGATHARSAELGHMVQVITGIPYFYRQCGYTMAVELDNHAEVPLAALQPLPPEQQGAFTLRPATEDDIPALLGWMDDAARGRMLSDQYSRESMRYLLAGQTTGSAVHNVPLVIVDKEGQDVGFVGLADVLQDPNVLRCVVYAVGEKSSYLATFPHVLRGLQAWATARYDHCPAVINLAPGIHETLDTMIDRSPGHIRRRTYAWYLRVPDAVAFLKHIAPVLEQRLEGSGANRYTGALRVGFYGLSGVSLKFDQGRLLAVESISGKDGYDAAFPWELFWNVVFGYRTVDEVGAILPDVWATQKGAALLEILFPKQKSFVLGLA
jgi:hypothetical protein